MLRNLAIICTALVFVGCVGVEVDRYPKEIRFRDIQAAADLAGVFKNQGSSQTGNWNPLLSELLFPEMSFSEPPDEVRISSATPSALKWEVMSQRKVLAVRDMVRGQNFRLVDGGVQFDRKLLKPILTSAGTGVGTESLLIRLTCSGDAVLSYKAGGAGLMLFVVPLATIKEQEALFERMEDGEQVTPATRRPAGQLDGLRF